MPAPAYFETLALTLCCLLACGLVGGVFASWLAWRLRPAARVFLSPILGAALFALLATLVGWAGHGFGAFPVRLVTLMILALAAWRQRREVRSLARRAGWWIAFGTIASLPLLHQLWIAGSYNVFNDTFMYLVHAQWLQTHGFTDPSGASWEHPAWAQVAGYQGPHLRMGASFLLGWVQAAVGAEWSCDVYAAVVMLGLICGALSIGATVLWACPGRWTEAWLAALGAAVTLNGFAFGAIHGFLPQTFGIAFGTAALSLWGKTLADRRSLHRRYGYVASVALCTAASVHSYSEFSPFLLSSAFLAIFFPRPVNSIAWRRRWQLVWPTLCAVFLLVNLEWIRMAQALPESAGIVAGKPYPWSWLRFPAHALGLAAGESHTPWPGIAFTSTAWGFWAAAASLTVGYALLIRRPRPTVAQVPRFRVAPLAPLCILLGLTAIAFLWFRYVASNPWQNDSALGPTATGQSWHQFKLSNWVSLAAISIAASLMLDATTRGFRRVVIGLLALWCAAGLAMNLALSSRRVTPFLSAVGVPSNPFGAYRALRDAMRDIPVTDTILIESEIPDARPRRLLTYFLHDRKLSGRWADDPQMLAVFLPPATPGAHQWVIRFNPAANDLTVPPEKFGRMTLDRAGPPADSGPPR